MILGVHPMINENGVSFVVALGHVLIQLMHGWPGKTLFWLLSCTTPAARTVLRFGRLKPLLYHIPFGFVTSLSCP